MLALSRIRGIISKRTVEVVPGVYQLTTRGVNIILIAEGELTLIDTGFRSSPKQIVKFIDELGFGALSSVGRVVCLRQW